MSDPALQQLAGQLRAHIATAQQARQHRLDLLLAWTSGAARGAPLLAQSLGQQLLLRSLWQRVRADFEQAGIPVVPLKGLVWAEALFPHPGLRPYGDLDVLVAPGHVEAARQRLLALGGVQTSLPNLQLDDVPSWHFHWVFAFASGAQQQAVELHWELGRPGQFSLPAQQIWQQVQQGPAGLRLRPEAELYLACLHAYRHGLYPYRTLVDVARMLQLWGPRLDWARLWSIAQAADAVGLVALMLLLAQRQLAAPLPTDALSRRELGARRVRLAAGLLSPRRLLHASHLPRMSLMAASLGGWRPLTRHLRDQLLPLPALLQARYGCVPGTPRFYATAVLHSLRLLCGRLLKPGAPR